MPDLDIEQKPSRRLWILRGGSARSRFIVGGGALAVAHLQTDDLDDYARRASDRDRARTDIAAALKPPICRPDRTPMLPWLRRRLAEQKAEVKETDLPKDAPTETDDPDRVVTPNDSNKPKEDDPKSRRGADFGFDGIRGAGSHRAAVDRRCAGR